MKTETTTNSAIAVTVQNKLDEVKQHALFRLGVFTLSVAAGWFFSRLVYAGFRLLPTLGAGAHDKVSPLAEMLKVLHSGFGG